MPSPRTVTGHWRKLRPKSLCWAAQRLIHRHLLELCSPHPAMMVRSFPRRESEWLWQVIGALCILVLVAAGSLGAAPS
ncbi:unnamed protein product [Effrenium voratum]|nr:unnamed protein product [Effrenium voratum]